MSEKKIILITGGNAGIGYETVKSLLQSDRPYLILMGCRSLAKAQDAIAQLHKEVAHTPSTVEAVQVDVASDESIERAFEQVQAKHGRVDALVNNAGASFEHELQDGRATLREVWNKAYDVNVSGTNVLTHTFIPLLLRSSDPRLLFITSGLASLQRTSARFYPVPNPPAPGWPKAQEPDGGPGLGAELDAYRSSKTALNMMMLNWNWRLTRDGVKVWSISPGFLATGLVDDAKVLKARGAGHPSIGGNFIKDVVEGKRDADVGKVVFNDGSVQPF